MAKIHKRNSIINAKTMIVAIDIGKDVQSQLLCSINDNYYSRKIP